MNPVVGAGLLTKGLYDSARSEDVKQAYKEYGVPGAIAQLTDPVGKHIGGATPVPAVVPGKPTITVPQDLIGANAGAEPGGDTGIGGGQQPLPGGSGGAGGAESTAAAAYMAQLRGQMPDLAAQEARMRDAFNMEQEALAGVAMQQYAAAREHEARLAGIQAHAQDRTALMSKYNAAFNKATKDFVEHPELDDRRWWSKKDTGQKIATVVGSLLSGFAMGLAGKPEKAADYINDQITLDLELQKAEYNRSHDRQGAVGNAWEMARKQMNSDEQAEYLVRAAALDKVKADVEARMADVNIGKGKLGMEQFLYNLQERRQQALEEALLRFMAKRGGGSGGGSGLPVDAAGVVTWRPEQAFNYDKKTYIVANPTQQTKLEDAREHFDLFKTAVSSLESVVPRLKNNAMARADLTIFGDKGHAMETADAAVVRGAIANAVTAMRGMQKTGAALSATETDNLYNGLMAAQRKVGTDPEGALSLLKQSQQVMSKSMQRHLNTVASAVVPEDQVQRRVSPKSMETTYFGAPIAKTDPAGDDERKKANAPKTNPVKPLAKGK